ncbi:MAG: M20 aminoacylase family protein [Methylococcales bacterium]|jgi:hippurate hydrolase|nr:M20 aminoacylase family protein [Methylococcales bacterium]
MKAPSHFLEPLFNDMRQWRQHLHQHPETAFEEIQTAQFISDKLKSFGLDVHQGLGGTGVVASITAGDSHATIGLRADMDALPIQELNSFTYKSVHNGKMHACGHDGHSAMLLGAACYLSQQQNFNGTVRFIFQPAEEGRAGAQRMIEEGLFKQFPVDSVYGMHNFPDLPEGHFAIKAGAMMASFNCFKITVAGQATHAAMPHLGKDPIVATAHLITALQTIISRTVDPAQAAVLSVTQIRAGNTWNAIPESAQLKGTFRCFSPIIEKQLQSAISGLATTLCKSFGLKATIEFNPENPGYPVTWNDDQAAQLCTQVATTIAGKNGVELNPEPSLGAEDFAFMLKEKPGCYIWIGNGPSTGSCLLHNPHYDFNDAILPVGAAYWVKLTETLLAP